MPSTIIGENAITVPADTTTNRPANSAGLIRFNTTTSFLEVNNGNGWIDINVFSPTSISGLVGWYDVSSVSGTTWIDKSGAGNNATISGATVQSTSGNGASKISSALYGSTTGHTLNFPSAILPTTYTLFHVTRYTGGSNGRIYTSNSSINWLSGHWGGASGVAYHEGWLTPSSPSVHGNNWLISTDQRSLYRSNGVTRGTGSGASCQLTINGTGYGGESSTWMTTECIVYNKELSVAQYTAIESYLSSKYGITLG